MNNALIDHECVIAKLKDLFQFTDQKLIALSDLLKCDDINQDLFLIAVKDKIVQTVKIDRFYYVPLIEVVPFYEFYFPNSI